MKEFNWTPVTSLSQVSINRELLLSTDGGLTGIIYIVAGNIGNELSLVSSSEILSDGSIIERKGGMQMFPIDHLDYFFYKDFEPEFTSFVSIPTPFVNATVHAMRQQDKD